MGQDITGGFLPTTEEFSPNIKIFGVGGGGGNVVSRMKEEGVTQVELIACNTDIKALQRANVDTKIELGRDLTRGRGAGGVPEKGENAAEETLAEIEEQLVGTHMVFVAAGMGGGTGTGAAPVIAHLAKKQNILTVGVVTLPFYFEGKRRMRIALEGIKHLKEHTDTLLVIPNDKLYDASNPNTKLMEAFSLVDSVLVDAIQGITDLLSDSGTINVDFADMRTIMVGMGKAVIGKGMAVGKDCMNKAVHAAIHSPLMQDSDIRGAKGILIHVLGPEDTSAMEIAEAMEMVEDMADEEVNLIWGATFSREIENEISITIIATGLPD